MVIECSMMNGWNLTISKQKMEKNQAYSIETEEFSKRSRANEKLSKIIHDHQFESWIDISFRLNYIKIIKQNNCYVSYVFNKLRVNFTLILFCFSSEEM